MKLADPEITNLKNQIEGWSEEIAIIDFQYQAATDVALKFAQQLDSLRSKHRSALRKLRDIEQHACGSYMWENIGDGG